MSSSLRDKLIQDVEVHKDVAALYDKINRKLYLNIIAIAAASMILMSAIFFYFNKPSPFDVETAKTLKSVDSILKIRVNEARAGERKTDTMSRDIDTVKRRVKRLPEAK